MTRIAATILVEAIEKYVAAMIINHQSPHELDQLKVSELREELIVTVMDKVQRAGHILD
jgi:hypothetical protein